MQPRCKGKHAAGVHQLLGGVDASVNLVAEEGREAEEDEDLYVNIAKIGKRKTNGRNPMTHGWSWTGEKVKGKQECAASAPA
jgi:hypothetical protein